VNATLTFFRHVKGLHQAARNIYSIGRFVKDNKDLAIKAMTENHLSDVIRVHAECFPRQTLSAEWITCNFKAYPRIRYFVATLNNQVIGYIQWTEKSGFRIEVVMELEQIAVHPSMQKRGIATKLILKSLPLIKKELKKRDAFIKHIIVTTRTDNHAQKLYKKTLNAHPETTITNLFSADEVFMIARNIQI
jgi:ribosomal protein S18 acetylase RimI-like enzyme